MVSIVEDFNKIRLHDPEAFPDVMKLYDHIDEIKEIDNRGFELCRPLFSHSELPKYLDCKNIDKKEFKWDQEFIYSVLLHHNNDLAAKHLNLIPFDILEAVRKGSCKLILDNVLEGNSIDKFLDILYKSILTLNLPADRIYYVTNNLLAEKVHADYLEKNPKIKSINVISFMYNVMDVHNLKVRPLYHNPIIKGDSYEVNTPYETTALPQKLDIEEEIEYKKQNIDKIKKLLKVNRTNREERNLFMLYLNKHELLDNFALSFPDLPENYYYPEQFKHLLEPTNIESLKNKLPFDIDESDRTNHGPAGFGLNEFDADLPFNPIHYRDTFISVVMCAFPFTENACHLHSSTFNPIYCGHPVIEFGPYRHLRELKNRGFKTFDKWWDESYDEIENPWDRFNEILKIVHKLALMSKDELLEMYIDMKDILQYNSDLISNFDGKSFLKDRLL